MAGNRAIYEQAVNEGNSAAWDQQWEQAIASYARALDEFPDDASVMSSLGLALLAQNRWEQALAVYQRAAQLKPDDPLPLEKCAEILDRLNKSLEASQAYYLAAEAFVAKRDVTKAVQNWTRSVTLNIDHFQSYSRLALANERIGKNTDASHGYVQVARMLQKQGDMQKALQAAQRAAQLDPRNQAALKAVDMVQHGAMIPDPQLNRPAGGATFLSPAVAFAPVDMFSKESRSIHANWGKKSNPLEDGRQFALSQLANLLFETTDDEADSKSSKGKRSTNPFKHVKNTNRAQVVSVLTQAIEAQSKGNAETAAPLLEKVVKLGLEHPAINYLLGASHFDGERYRDAAKQLNTAAENPAYASGAYFCIGLCYGRDDKMKEAVSYLMRSLQYVDLVTVPDVEKKTLTALYENYQERIGKNQTEEQLTQLGETIVGFLSGTGWRERVEQARQQLNAQKGNNALVPLAEIVSIPGADRLMESLSLIEKYAARKMWASALDECQNAVEFSPTYLPVHMRMAEILAQEKRIEPALAKYEAVAGLYNARGETVQAVQIFQQMAHLAPMDLNIRSKLSQLLAEQGRTVDAIRYSLETAQIHIDLADFDQARQAYNGALLLAQKTSVDKAVTTHILHKIGELDMQRADWRQATRTYEQIKSQSPSDDRARVSLIDLYYRLGNARQAVVETDDLIKYYLATEGLPRAIQVTEAIVNQHGEDLGLRQRLIRLYQQVGRKEDAIAQLDAIADMFHQAGNVAETIKTIQAIIALEPDNVAEYRELLSQLQSSA
jgi:tetratricopeptide (TPR) repeat protein